MANINVPISITYDTAGLTPIPDMVAALEAADTAINDAISLLPSFIDGLHIESEQVNVRSLSQESPLRELFIVSLIVAFQDDLKTEIPPILETILQVDIPDGYDSFVTVVTMIVLFYGASFLKDAALKTVGDDALRRQVENLIAQIAKRTGKSEDEVRAILDAKYSSLGTVKRLAKAVQGFFIPSQREGAKAITFDSQRVPSEVIKEVPYAEEFSDKEDFEKYKSFSEVELELHAQDRDKMKTGWAAVPVGINEKRLRMKLVEPMTSDQIWGKDRVIGNIILVSKLTSDGYEPSEIHLTSVNSD